MIASMAAARTANLPFDAKLAQPARGQPGIRIVRAAGEMQVHGKDADNLADTIRHHLVDDARALVERDKATGGDTARFREARMRHGRGDRGRRWQMAIEQRACGERVF